MTLIEGPMKNMPTMFKNIKIKITSKTDFFIVLFFIFTLNLVISIDHE